MILVNPLPRSNLTLPLLFVVCTIINQATQFDSYSIFQGCSNGLSGSTERHTRTGTQGSGSLTGGKYWTAWSRCQSETGRGGGQTATAARPTGRCASPTLSGTRPGAALPAGPGWTTAATWSPRTGWTGIEHRRWTPHICDIQLTASSCIVLPEQGRQSCGVCFWI